MDTACAHDYDWGKLKGVERKAGAVSSVKCRKCGFRLVLYKFDPDPTTPKKEEKKKARSQE